MFSIFLAMFSEDFDFEGEGLLLALPKHFDEERFDHKTKGKKKHLTICESFLWFLVGLDMKSSNLILITAIYKL